MISTEVFFDFQLSLIKRSPYSINVKIIVHIGHFYITIGSKLIYCGIGYRPKSLQISGGEQHEPCQLYLFTTAKRLLS